MNQLLDELSATVASAQTVEQLARPLLEMLETVTGLESTYLTTVDESRGLQHVLFARNTGTLRIPEGLNVPWSDTLCKRALEEDTRYTDQVAERWGDSEAASALGIRTYASTPVRNGDGALYGTLCAASATPQPLTPQSERIFALFAYLIAQQVERERLIQKLIAANERLAAFATTDQLTGLPNRRALMAALERMLALGRRQKKGVQIVFVDLDKFKAINDTHGHEVGDQFLTVVAQRLQGMLRAEDLAARLGGDEFVVISLSQHTGDAAKAAEETLATRITQATQGWFALPGASFDYAGASVGAVTVPHEQRYTADEALRLADRAMYQVKLARHATKH